MNEPPLNEHDDDTVRCHCGHWCSESRCTVIDGLLICSACALDPLVLRPVGAVVKVPERV